MSELLFVELAHSVEFTRLLRSWPVAPGRVIPFKSF
jgi:hypothetical protein